MMPYERLKAWQSCHQLTIATYRITNSFPKSELYGLVSQMRRAAFSAAANLAEGSGTRARLRLWGRVERTQRPASRGGKADLGAVQADQIERDHASHL